MSDEVAGRLRTEIMTGVLRPDTFIRLDETAARLGVSITPVREALRTLRGEGMVELEPHRGHRVMPLSRADIEDIFWIQSTIARELVTTTARRIDDTQIEQLVEAPVRHLGNRKLHYLRLVNDGSVGFGLCSNDSTLVHFAVEDGEVVRLRRIGEAVHLDLPAQCG